MLSHRVATSSFRRRGPSSLLRRLSSSAAYASAPYRQLAWASDQQKTAWAAEDTKLHAKMREHVPEALAHNGEEAFDHHLVGVQSVLRSWQAPKHLCDAALFHFIEWKGGKRDKGAGSEFLRSAAAVAKQIVAGLADECFLVNASGFFRQLPN